MTGILLGFDSSSNTGVISGDDGNRYNFKKESFKDKIELKKDLKLDFSVNEENQAIDIYYIKDIQKEDTNMGMGLVAVILTFLLGFIGTLISRIALAKQTIGVALIPTLIHFLLTFCLVIPIIGWLIYFLGTAYFMYKNYMLTIGARE